jgi:hypothetical protein
VLLELAADEGVAYFRVHVKRFLMFSLGIRQLFDDLTSTLGPDRLILAYLDDIYLLSNDPKALEYVQAFFASRQPSIQLILTKSGTLALHEASETGSQLLGG